jgi:hypothetical protein
MSVRALDQAVEIGGLVIERGAVPAAQGGPKERLAVAGMHKQIPD